MLLKENIQKCRLGIGEIGKLLLRKGEHKLDAFRQLIPFDCLKYKGTHFLPMHITGKPCLLLLGSIKIHVALAEERPQSRTIAFWDRWKNAGTIDITDATTKYITG